MAIDFAEFLSYQKSWNTNKSSAFYYHLPKIYFVSSIRVSVISQDMADKPIESFIRISYISSTCTWHSLNRSDWDLTINMINDTEMSITRRSSNIAHD